MSIEAASSLHRPIKIWADSLSSLMAIPNPKSHHSMVREIRIFLLSHKHIHLRWLNAHIGYLGNECRHMAKRSHHKRRPFLFSKDFLPLQPGESGDLNTGRDKWDKRRNWPQNTRNSD
ncbi:hypothetical protein AVEN_201207-1 [Araneus ventricosus]|uniref:RNase H type-1 domain-containing protein n=1 Tax=Araneus ventricosus TaxID=182803 RepID=A0A4Y2HPF4_ARAVE|nr:hypothetical protein AVEN_201207-1 [Araneus ventricosus]